MKSYLVITEVEHDTSELIIKVEPLLCSPLYNNILNTNNIDYIPAKGDKLYFLPGVNIPRIKLKDLSLAHGIKTVRDIDEATHVFGGNSTLNKIVDTKWYYSIATQAFKDMLVDIENSNLMDGYYIQNLKDALEFYTEDVLIANYSIKSIIRNISVTSVMKYTSNHFGNSELFYVICDEYKDLFPTISNIDIISESNLLKYINGADATVIDEIMFKQLYDMFESSDTDNHIIAMEIMANSDYIDSLIYIEMLFEEFSSKMSDCRTKSHVNFKSLISFLGKNKSYMHTDIDDIVKSLITKNVFDIDKVKIIMKYYGKRIAEQGGTDYFHVKSITLSGPTAEMLNINFVHETVIDYVPVDVEEVTEDVCSDNAQIDEITEEDIVEAFTRIERNDLKTELIELESEIIEQEITPVIESEEEVIINNQIKETNGDDFEWF